MLLADILIDRYTTVDRRLHSETPNSNRFANQGQEGGGRRRTLVTSLPAARMRAIAGAVASTATAM